jgi:hypothetical protein
MTAEMQRKRLDPKDFLGFDFKLGWIEVPIAYLYSDEDADRHKPDPNG